MNADELRALQAPLKEQYRGQPESAVFMLRAEARLDEGIACKIETALTGMNHSCSDVSHRSCGVIVNGPQAAIVLNHGCPLDLSHASFPVGMCTRTLFEKAEIVLWRLEKHTYHVNRAFTRAVRLEYAHRSAPRIRMILALTICASPRRLPRRSDNSPASSE